MNTNFTNGRMARMDTPIVYKDLSYTIIEASMEVHKILGPGFTEKLYEEAVIREIARRSITFERQKLIEVFYKGNKIGEYRLDIVVDNKVILELKAVSDMNSTFEAQLFSYLKATNFKLGILINFGKQKLEFKRTVN